MSESIPFHFHGIDHVVLKVTSAERSLAFYRDVLGLHLERIIEDVGIYQLRCGRNIVDLQVLAPGASLAAVESRGIDHLCLHVAGRMADILDHLARHGVAPSFGPVELYGATGFGTSIYVPDPDGHTIELKLDHAEHPLRTTAREATTNLTREPPSPRRR